MYYFRVLNRIPLTGSREPIAKIFLIARKIKCSVAPKNSEKIKFPSRGRGSLSSNYFWHLEKYAPLPLISIHNQKLC